MADGTPLGRKKINQSCMLEAEKSSKFISPTGNIQDVFNCEILDKERAANLGDQNNHQPVEFRRIIGPQLQLMAQVEKERNEQHLSENGEDVLNETVGPKLSSYASEGTDSLGAQTKITNQSKEILLPLEKTSNIESQGNSEVGNSKNKSVEDQALEKEVIKGEVDRHKKTDMKSK